jgi:C-terminal processing protease CtpA/Prc
MRQLKFILLTNIVIFSTVCAASSLPNFLDYTNNLIFDKYVNPRNIDLQKWSANLRQKAFASCRSKCDEEVVKNILVDEVRRIGDPHFEVLNYGSTRIEDTFPVGDGHQPNSFGFILEPDQSDLIVRYVHSGMPAADIFQIGDQILSVNNIIKKDTFRAIAGAENSGQSLEFKYLRDGSIKTVRLSPTGTIWKPSYTMLDNKVLWLHLTNTSEEENADRIVHDAIRTAKVDNLKGVILDLRYRSGGDPFTEINAAGAFIPFLGSKLCDNKRICIDYSFKAGAHEYFNHKTGEHSTEYFENPSFWDGPLVVLTSKYTFSGGENVANILQSIKRAKVLGEPSGGGAGVTGNSFYVGRSKKTQAQTIVFIPQYRHYDLVTYVARPLKVIPDQLVPVDLEKLKAGRDNQLEAAIEELGIK